MSRLYSISTNLPEEIGTAHESVIVVPFVGYRPATCAFAHSTGFVVRWGWVRLCHPTLSREARLSVGFF